MISPFLPTKRLCSLSFQPPNEAAWTCPTCASPPDVASCPHALGARPRRRSTYVLKSWCMMYLIPSGELTQLLKMDHLWLIYPSKLWFSIVILVYKRVCLVAKPKKMPESISRMVVRCCFPIISSFSTFRHLFVAWVCIAQWILGNLRLTHLYHLFTIQERYPNTLIQTLYCNTYIIHNSHSQ